MPNPFGEIFPETLIQTHGRMKSSRIPHDLKKPDHTDRIWIFVILLIFGLGILTARLFTLSLIRGREYRSLSEGNRIREKKITSARGIIYDRLGKALVRNIPLFTTDKGEKYFEDKPATLSAHFSESIERDYIYKKLFAHVIGFTGEVNNIELGNKRNAQTMPYQIGDRIGKIGIEKSYDDILRGRNGKELEEVDAIGNQVRVLGRIDPKPGGNLNLSLDLDLQRVAYEAMQDKKGAVVVEDPNTGSILALISTPSFDPNNFIKNEDLDKLLSDTNQPLFNRAISGLYPPGSTFKIVTSLAALETGSINASTMIEDTGILQVGSFSFGNWYFSQYGRKEGMVDIVKALKRSNDIFFYKTGEMTGIENIAQWAEKIGIGRKLGIDIAGEEKGLMPDPKWQKETKNENWYLGNTYHAAIGQGDILTTPLQVNAWTNVIANGGKLCSPHLLKTESGKYTSDGVRMHSSEVEGLGQTCRDLGIKKENIELIMDGMKEACSTGGTGWPLFEFRIQNSELKIDNLDFFPTFESTTSGKPWVKIPVACKTGTAEFGDPGNRTHAWFTAFAPVHKPQISVTVLVEGGGEGSSVAGPIAKKILEEWFGKQDI